MTFRLALATLALALILPLTGCDESGSTSSDVTTIVADAQIARQNGDFDRAEALLRGALQQDASSAPVRSELAATLMARQGLNLLDLDRIATFIVDGTGGIGATASTPAASAHSGSCGFATDPTATPFDPTAVSGFPQIQASRADVDEALALLNPILPAELTTFNVCTSIGPDGGLVYDRAAATTQLRASGMTDAQIGQLLATNALVRFLNAYLFVTTEVGGTTWYRLADGGIGICADDSDTSLAEQARPGVRMLGRAVLSLDTRARSFGGSTELVGTASDAFGDIREAFGEICTAN